jgi:hypothetical protein
MQLTLNTQTLNKICVLLWVIHAEDIHATTKEEILTFVNGLK